MDVLDFSGSRRLQAARIHVGLRIGDPWSTRSTFDLSDMRWTDPGTLVGLAALMEDQTHHGRPPVLIGPTSDNHSRFLSRMGLGALVEELGGSHDLLPVTAWDQSKFLLELQRFDGNNAAGALATVVREQLPDGAVANAVHKGICEIGANALEHSLASHGYIAVVTTPGSREITFAVSDAGVGMVEPLRPQGFDTYKDAVNAVLDGGTSRLTEAGRGRGVRRTREVVTKAGGEVLLSSGPVAIRAWLKPDGRPLRNTRDSDLVLPGTLFQASLGTVP